MEGVIGTAGHVDHGKTTIIEALTGYNTDTLEEEKQRGITINLGFTHLDIDGKRYGIIDVPGHEKLVKNMLTGVFGMDLVLLVVAADDGIMPQTKEHLEILRYLKKTDILPIITKCDIASKERIDEVKDSLKEYGLHNPFEFGLHIDMQPLKKRIKEWMAKTDIQHEKDIRYPIDRVFHKKGLGTIVTGTLLTGSVQEGDTLLALPTMEEVRIKGLETYHETTVEVFDHTRVAMQVKSKSELQRGMMLVSNKPCTKSRIIDVKIDNPNNHQFEHLHAYKVHLYSSNFLVILKLLKEKQTNASTFYAQLLFSEDVFFMKRDVGIIRNLNPKQTLAGVEVIRAKGEYVSRQDEEYTQLLQHHDTNNIRKQIKDVIYKQKTIAISELKKELPDITDVDLDGFPDIEGVIFSDDYFVTLESHVKQLLKQFHKENPYELGIPLPTLKQSTANNLQKNVFKSFLKLISCHVDERVSLPSFQIVIAKEHQNIQERLLRNTSGFQPIKVHDLLQTEVDKQVLRAMLNLGEIIEIDSSIYINKETEQTLIHLIRSYFKDHKSLLLKDARDLLNSTRSYVVPMLEYLDKKKITKRVMDGRVLKNE